MCLLGPNGIGKTTLLNCLARLREPLEGSVLLNGQEMRNMPSREVAQTIGYVPQTLLPAFDYTVLEYVVTGNALVGHLRKARSGTLSAGDGSA